MLDVMEIAERRRPPHWILPLVLLGIEEFEPPATDPSVREELEEFVSRRKREGGAPTDF